jgi:hypothetical protein
LPHSDSFLVPVNLSLESCERTVRGLTPLDHKHAHPLPRRVFGFGLGALIPVSRAPVGSANLDFQL